MADETLATAQVEIIASLDGLRDGLDQARDAIVVTMDTVDERVSETGRLFESAFASAGERMLTAIVGAGRAKDAWLSLGNAALGLTEDVERLVLQLTILDPLLNTLFGVSTGGSLPTMGSPFGDLFSAAGASVSGQFARAGGLDVAASAGADSQLIRFRAANVPGAASEHVKIGPSETRGTGLSLSPQTTNVVVNNYGSDQASVDRRRNVQGGEDITVRIGKVMARDVHERGALGQAIEQVHGAARVPIQR